MLTCMAESDARAGAHASCPSCGRAVHDAKFCDQCGTRMPVRIECGACGHANVDAKFCERCGQSLARAITANPYAPPKSALEDPMVGTAEAQLASRGARLGAALIDAIAVSLINVPLLLGADLLPLSGPSPGPVQLIPVAVISFIGFALVQGWFLARGQTVGKLLLGLRIVDVESGEPPGVAHLLGLRYLLTSVLGVFGALGSLVGTIGILMIFTSQRRCLHDLIASTKVVWADPRRG